jgi:serine/threonine protein kinase/tetratricopeptide (TPR) repeat protein
LAVRRDNKVVTEEWERVKELFETALDCPPEHRIEFLSRLQQDDPAVARQVSDLIASHERAGDFLHQPLIFASNFLDDLEEPQRFAPNDVLCNRFKIVGLIGKGGMGEVYEAFDQELEEHVALKTLRFEVSSNEIFTARFRREIQLARKVTHPNVCRIFESLRHQAGNETVSVLSMELLQGQTLGDYLKSKGRLTADEALPLAGQIIEGLSAVHAAGIIHRDLKPSNFVLVPEGDSFKVKITDFGIAGGLPANPSQPAHTQASKILGTPDYMAPEQLEHGRATIQSDIYSLGLVLYEMVTGAKPFSDAGAWKRLYEDPRPPKKLAPDLPDNWNKTIVCCLERNAEYRFSTATDVEHCLSEHDSAIPHKPLSVRLKSTGKLKTAGRFITTLAVVALAVASIGYFNQRSPIPRGTAVLLTEIRNDTKNPYFSGITLALKNQLEQSGYFEAMRADDARVVKALEQMKRTTKDLADHYTSREVALRGGASLVVFGSLGKNAQGYVLSIAIERARYTPLMAAARWSQDFTAKDEKDLLNAAYSAATWIRTKAGEPSADLVNGNKPVEDITTSSWAALRLLNEANTMIAEEDYKSAERLLHGALEEDPSFVLARMRLADILISTRRDNEGLKEWQKTFDSIRTRELVSKKELTDRENLRIKGQYYEDTGDYLNAERVFANFTRLYPDDYLGWFYLGSTLDKQGEKQKALDLFARAAKLRPESSATHAHIAMLQISLKNYPAAAKEIQAVGDLGASEWASWLKVILAFAQEDTDRALAQTAILSSSPQVNWQSQAYSIRSDLLARQGKRDQAITVLNQGISFDRDHALKPAQADKLIGLAYLYYRRKDHNSCQRAALLATAFDNSPRHLLEAGILFARIGGLEQAEKEIRELRLHSIPLTQVSIDRIKGEILMARNNPQAAIQYLESAVKNKSPGHNNLALAEALIAAGLQDQAAKEVKRVTDDPAHNLMYRDHDFSGLWNIPF